MNKTKIEWCDYTWNPVTGCKHNCEYCYARKIAARFAGTPAWPTGFDPLMRTDRLGDPLTTKGARSIFVCSMADLFGQWVPNNWIDAVFDACRQAPKHTYIFLTKSPVRYSYIRGEYFTGNKWFGASITSAKDLSKIEYLQKQPEGNFFVSFEPLLGDLGDLNLDGIGQVIIGAQTNPTVEVNDAWVMSIEKEADRVGAKIFVKDSLMYHPTTCRRELAWGIHK